MTCLILSEVIKIMLNNPIKHIKKKDTSGFQVARYMKASHLNTKTHIFKIIMCFLVFMIWFTDVLHQTSKAFTEQLHLN